jgi:hypothetical protein
MDNALFSSEYLRLPVISADPESIDHDAPF